MYITPCILCPYFIHLVQGGRGSRKTYVKRLKQGPGKGFEVNSYKLINYLSYKFQIMQLDKH